MPEWKTYKGQNPWALEKQGNKFGYVNNPNFHSPASEDHNPCGYWSKGTRPRTADYSRTVWYVDGAAVIAKVLEVGDGKDFKTFGEACSEASTIPGSVLLLVFPGSYESGGIISGSNRTVYVRGMGASPLDVEFLNCCPQVSGAGHNLFLENVYIHYTTGAGFTSIQFSTSMGNLDLNKVQITDPNVPVEYTPFLAGLTWTGNLTASYTTLTATWNWELVFFQFDPSRISFNKVSYVGGYWGESSCAVQFATYNQAVEDCGALYGSFRITEEIKTETLSLTPLWPSTRWQTFDKNLYPWIVVPPTSLKYNEGDKIAIAPQVSGGSPIWDMEHNGNNVTDLHDPCKYWYNGDWYSAWLITKLCESINIAYTKATMLVDTHQTLSLEDSNGNAITADIVVWFLTGVGSLTGEVGSSVIYNAPSTVTEEAHTATIEAWCNGVIRDTLTILIATGKILYTTPQQPPGTTQDITVENPNCEYTWELIGGGSLSVVNGVVKYTAPTSNPNCENNATINMLCDGVIVDSIQIAINVSMSTAVAYRDQLGFGSLPEGGGYVCGGSQFYAAKWGGCCSFHYLCNGTIQTTRAHLLCSCSGCPLDMAHEVCDPCPEGVLDLRTELMKLQGCCPAQLM